MQNKLAFFLFPFFHFFILSFFYFFIFSYLCPLLAAFGLNDD